MINMFQVDDGLLFFLSPNGTNTGKSGLGNVHLANDELVGVGRLFV